MDRAINVLLHQKIIDRLNILILPSVGGANDSTDTNSILINELHSFLRVDYVTILGAVDIALLNLEVASCFLPADLDSRVHDDVRFGVVFASRFTLVLPALLHGEGTEHLHIA